MNTISIHAEAQTASFQVAKPLGVIDLGLPRKRPAATWLPAPVTSRTGRAIPKKASGVRTHPSTAWRDTAGEKILFGLLVLVAAAAVGYGFNCMVNLVQHWALFGAGVGQLIQ